MGADALEMDVRQTSDGTVVVIHDATVDRTTDGSGKVADMTLEQLRELDAGHGERLSTLDEVFASVSDVPIIIEVKEARAASVTRDILLTHNAVSRVVVGSFDGKILDPLRRAGVKCCADRFQTGVTWALARLGFRSPVRAELFSIPPREGRLTVVDRRFVRAASKVGKPVHVWTVDTESEARSLWEVGVNGIITNRPEAILGVRKEMLRVEDL